VRLAEEGADIIAVDIVEQMSTVPYPMATPEDLEETVRQVEALDRRIVARRADVRDLGALRDAVDAGLSEFGHIDVICANAGILSFGGVLELDEDVWQDVLDVNLTGVWKTVRAAAPSMVERGQGGSIILTSSVAGLVAYLGFAHYVSAKHGVTGLMRAMAMELAPHRIRVNSVHPTTVDTPMVQNPALYEVFGVPGASRDEAAQAFRAVNALPVPWVEAVDVSNAVLYLASDESRYVTGLTMTVDAGATAPYKPPPEA
jgi:SDR family mycofactocin-dependent oxidoreductase